MKLTITGLKSLLWRNEMNACKYHPYTIVVFEETRGMKRCPLCESERIRKELDKKLDEANAIADAYGAELDELRKKKC